MPVAAVSFGRQAHGQLGVEDDDRGQHVRVEYDAFHMGVVVGDHRRPPTSEPVPAVVGTATTGAMPATLTRR